MSPAILVLMGVSGAGKSTVGPLLAERLGWPYRDADGFHPPANIAKMSADTPLTDEDRRPWLAAIAAWIDERRAAGGHGIVSCSALKRAYREVLVGGRPDVLLVYLRGEEGLIARRQAARTGHFMPATLVRSQFETLEEPAPDERALTVRVDQPPEAVAAEIAAALAVRSA